MCRSCFDRQPEPMKSILVGGCTTGHCGVCVQCRDTPGRAPHIDVIDAVVLHKTRGAPEPKCTEVDAPVVPISPAWAGCSHGHVVDKDTGHVAACRAPVLASNIPR